MCPGVSAAAPSLTVADVDDAFAALRIQSWIQQSASEY
jgi:hypothetical protein